ncbi:MAG TPA: HEAT repeat domain-containing protein [Verrucomicrobiae bacterium]|nr:HEAT repeat domain-containing protein [Verrucomicrobiae bacterium]
MVNMFSVEHTNSLRPVQVSYDLLNDIVKQTRYLTVGFVNERVLLNSILTSEPNLKPLENEFLKRGIGAVTFDAGITLAAYRDAVAVLAASAQTIEECGGLMPLLDQRQLAFVRIFPANKNEVRNKHGDTILEVGSEEFLISKALSEIKPDFSHGMDAVLNRVERLNVMGGQGHGDGNVEKNGQGPSGGLSGGLVRVAGNSVAGPGGDTIGGSFGAIQQAVDQKFESFLRNPDDDPKKAYEQLASLIRGLRPDYVLSAMSAAPAGSSSSTKAPSEQVTSELFEDAALRWASQRLAAAPTGEEAVIVEEQVFRVLLRSLQATQTASRLAHRLTELAVEYALPRQTVDRMQQEIRWMTLAPPQKLRDLLAIGHYSLAEFRRLIELMKDLISRGKMEDAVALGTHYFAIFQNYDEIKIEEVGRVPDLLRTLAGVSNEFRLVAAECLTTALTSDRLNRIIHIQVVNALAALATTTALYEDFAATHRIGAALELSAARDLEVHAKCCTATLASLLPASAVDRIGELFIQRRTDPVWARIVVALLRWSGPRGVDRLFAKLESESSTANRLVLVRLLARLGDASLVPARQRLVHPEWYVVRNACKVLGELKDPELLQQIEPALHHKDPRVQKAAMKTVMESRMPGSAAVIAWVLPGFAPAVLEEALDELSYHKDQSCLPGLESYLDGPGASNTRMALKVIQAIAAIPGDAAAEILENLAYDSRLNENARRATLQALHRRELADDSFSDGVQQIK